MDSFQTVVLALDAAVHMGTRSIGRERYSSAWHWQPMAIGATVVLYALH